MLFEWSKQFHLKPEAHIFALGVIKIYQQSNWKAMKNLYHSQEKARLVLTYYDLLFIMSVTPVPERCFSRDELFH